MQSGTFSTCRGQSNPSGRSRRGERSRPHSQARVSACISVTSSVISSVALAALAGCGDSDGREDSTAASASASASMSGGSISMSGGESGSSSGATTPTTGPVEPTGTSDVTVDPTSTSGGSGLLVIDPAKSTVTLEDGVAPPQQLTAKLGGQPVTALWTSEASFLGSVDDSGLVTISGNYGGQIQVEALHEGQQAQAEVDVFFKKVITPPEVTEADKLLLDAAMNPDVEAVLAYPYDQMVYPKGLPSPELMWNGSAPGDKYLVHFSHALLDVKVYAVAEPPSRLTIEQGLWDSIAATVNGDTMDLRIHRLKVGEVAATVVADDTWTITSEPLIGSVYYWANSLGRVLRINPGALAPEDFLLAGGQDGCSTCHSVSANGKTLILGGDIAVSTWDLVKNAPVLDLTTVGKPIRDWAMAAVSPDGSVVVENGEINLPGPPGGGDGMWDALTGLKLANTGLEGITLDMPAFSPDGTKLAYVDHVSHALSVYNYDAALKQVNTPLELVPPGNDPALNGITFPSMSPDGKWIVYHRGAYPNSLDTRFGPGHLYIASSETPGQEVRLAGANGDAYPFVAGPRDLGWNYEPTFAPRTSGGYAWVVFTSRRTYGSRLLGTKDEAKQLWMMALEENPTPGVDPSHPAFWMPGQDLNTLNMRGFWALVKDDPGG